jgi:hypothetical protein
MKRMPDLPHQAMADPRHLRKAAEQSYSSSRGPRPSLWAAATGSADLDLTQFNEPSAIFDDDVRPCDMPNAIVQVGSRDGRGFIVGSAHGPRYVVTAARCLEHSRFPRPNLAVQVREWTFPNVIGPLGANRGTISAQLCVMNLTDDIAVFGEPNKELGYEAHQYQRFTNIAMPVAEPPATPEPCRWRNASGSRAWVLAPDGTWLSCSVHDSGRFLMLSGVEITSGMSGSPIVNADGAAIGLISAAEGGGRYDNGHRSLMDCLPAWLWRKLQCGD